MQALCKSRGTKLMAILLLVLTMASMLTVPVLAAGEDLAGEGVAAEVTTTPAPTIMPDNKDTSSGNPWIHKWGLDKDDVQNHIPNVTTDDVNNWVEHKGGDILSILQTAGKVIAAIGFVASIIIIIIGALGNRRMMTGGFIGLAISVLCYTALTYGKELMYLFSSWLVS